MGWAVGSLVGFSGSRSLPARFSPLVSGVAASVLAGGRGVAVGCAAGADRLVRSVAPAALVFRAASFPGPPAARLVARSVACVRAVAASGAGAGFAGFVSSPCPPSVSPSASPGRAFCGAGSGSWASLALAAGLGLPVVVFWCAAGPACLPAAWGAWVLVGGSGPWGAGWRLVPAAARLPGF